MRKLLFEIAQPEPVGSGFAMRPTTRHERAGGKARFANAAFFAGSLILLGAIAEIALRFL